MDVTSSASVLVNSGAEKAVRVRAGFADSSDSVGVETLSGTGRNAS